MKLAFTYSESIDISSLPRDELYRSYLILPDSVAQLPTAKEQALSIAGLVGQLTKADLHITCKELELKNHLVESLTEKIYPDGRLASLHKSMTLCFQGNRNSNIYGFREKSVVFKVRFPVIPPLHPSLYTNYSRKSRPLKYQLISPSFVGKTEEQIKYLATIQSLAEQITPLLNSELSSEKNYFIWTYRGFHPLWTDNAAIDAFNKRTKKLMVEAEKKEKQAQKLREREAKIAEAIKNGTEPASPITTGAGRRVGAVPGIFKGVQFRSQLEIRFVTQLEANQIQWIYEGERLGEGNYLVDFYLPDLKTWVEVKGKIEPRDDYFLKEIASFLKRERGERLFVYTSGKAYKVMAREFRELTHKEFWIKLAE